jgi:hypothetical protein
MDKDNNGNGGWDVCVGTWKANASRIQVDDRTATVNVDSLVLLIVIF